MYSQMNNLQGTHQHHHHPQTILQFQLQSNNVKNQQLQKSFQQQRQYNHQQQQQPQPEQQQPQPPQQQYQRHQRNQQNATTTTTLNQHKNQSHVSSSSSREPKDLNRINQHHTKIAGSQQIQQQSTQHQLNIHNNNNTNRIQPQHHHHNVIGNQNTTVGSAPAPAPATPPAAAATMLDGIRKHIIKNLNPSNGGNMPNNSLPMQVQQQQQQKPQPQPVSHHQSSQNHTIHTKHLSQKSNQNLQSQQKLPPPKTTIKSKSLSHIQMHQRQSSNKQQHHHHHGQTTQPPLQTIPEQSIAEQIEQPQQQQQQQPAWHQQQLKKIHILSRGTKPPPSVVMVGTNEMHQNDQTITQHNINDNNNNNNNNHTTTTQNHFNEQNGVGIESQQQQQQQFKDHTAIPPASSASSSQVNPSPIPETMKRRIPQQNARINGESTGKLSSIGNRKNSNIEKEQTSNQITTTNNNNKNDRDHQNKLGNVINNNKMNKIKGGAGTTKEPIVPIAGEGPSLVVIPIENTINKETTSSLTNGLPMGLTNDKSDSTSSSSQIIPINIDITEVSSSSPSSPPPLGEESPNSISSTASSSSSSSSSSNSSTLSSASDKIKFIAPASSPNNNNNNNNNNDSSNGTIIQIINAPPHQLTEQTMIRNSMAKLMEQNDGTQLSQQITSLPSAAATTTNATTTITGNTFKFVMNKVEKTPMCLVNELARYNKILHQYRLTSENGLAHKKTFTVTLKLGDEEFTAEGASIKKAQHAAALIAFEKTGYKHPPEKNNRSRKNGKTSALVPPTVELNALAMKLGEPTIYTVDNERMTHNENIQMGLSSGQQIPPFRNNTSMMPIHPQSFMNQTNLYYPNQFNKLNGSMMQNNGRYQNDQYRPLSSSSSHPPSRFRKFYENTEIPQEPYLVTLTVGNRTFSGIGHTIQSAKHDAAAKAIVILKNISAAAELQKNENHMNGGHDSNDGDDDDDDTNNDLKSPISLVHEMALKRHLTVTFDPHIEKGPPHMKIFTTLCKVGNLTTEGVGNGKRLSKRRAAERMVEELKKIPIQEPSPPLPPPQSSSSSSVILPQETTRKVATKQGKQKRKPPPRTKSKKPRNLIKEKLNADELIANDLNPISRLIQIQQAAEQKEPNYIVIDERGQARRREFTIEARIGDLFANGTGPNKKIAKKNAATKLLTLMGYEVPDGSVENHQTASSLQIINGGDHQLTSDINLNLTANIDSIIGKPSVNNLLEPNENVDNLMNLSPPSGKIMILKRETDVKINNNNGIINGDNTNNNNNQIIGGNARTNNSNVGGSIGSSNSNITENSIRPKDQLLYLAQLLGFQVQYSDFSKGNHGEFLTLVTLSTEPPQLCHGSGNSTEESHEMASFNALKMLSNLGLDNVRPKQTTIINHGNQSGGGGGGGAISNCSQMESTDGSFRLNEVKINNKTMETTTTATTSSFNSNINNNNNNNLLNIRSDDHRDNKLITNGI